MDGDSNDEQNLAFEVTDWDLNNEFNRNRPRARQTKEQAIYGIIYYLIVILNYSDYFSFNLKVFGLKVTMMKKKK